MLSHWIVLIMQNDCAQWIHLIVRQDYAMGVHHARIQLYTPWLYTVTVFYDRSQPLYTTTIQTTPVISRLYTATVHTMTVYHDCTTWLTTKPTRCSQLEVFPKKDTSDDVLQLFISWQRNIVHSLDKRWHSEIADDDTYTWQIYRPDR